MDWSPNDLMPLGRGVYPFIYSPVGSTCAVGSNRLNQGPRWLFVGGGGSFQKEAKTLTLGRRPTLGWGRPAPPSGLWPPSSSAIVFPCLDRDPSVVDKFHVYFAVESPFSAFLEINPRKYRICKTRVFMFSFGSKALIKVDIIDRQQ